MAHRLSAVAPLDLFQRNARHAVDIAEMFDLIVLPPQYSPRAITPATMRAAVTLDLSQVRLKAVHPFLESADFFEKMINHHGKNPLTLAPVGPPPRSARVPGASNSRKAAGFFPFRVFYPPTPESESGHEKSPADGGVAACGVFEAPSRMVRPIRNHVKVAQLNSVRGRN
jgi:hypothetical protein